MSIRVLHVYVFICASCLFMNRGTAAPGERMRPARWLSMRPGGCDNDEEMKPVDSFTIFWTGRHYDCERCKVVEGSERLDLVAGDNMDRYHIKYDQVQPWQLNEEGMQICLFCPKWTLHYNYMKTKYLDWGLPGTDTTHPYDIWDEVKKPTCMSQCPWKLDGLCTGEVVSKTRLGCQICAAGYVPFELNILGQSYASAVALYNNIYWQQIGLDPVRDIINLPNLKDFSKNQSLETLYLYANGFPPPFYHPEATLSHSTRSIVYIYIYI